MAMTDELRKRAEAWLGIEQERLDRNPHGDSMPYEGLIIRDLLAENERLEAYEGAAHYWQKNAIRLRKLAEEHADTIEGMQKRAEWADPLSGMMATLAGSWASDVEGSTLGRALVAIDRIPSTQEAARLRERIAELEAERPKETPGVLCLCCDNSALWSDGHPGVDGLCQECWTRREKERRSYASTTRSQATQPGDTE